MEEHGLHAKHHEGLEGSVKRVSVFQFIAEEEPQEFVWPELHHVLAAAQDPNVVENYQGIRDERLLDSGLGAALNQHYYGGVSDPFELAAHLFSSIERQQAIVEGNKRTASHIAANFLANNGYPDALQKLEARGNEYIEMLVGVAEHRITVEQLAAYMRGVVDPLASGRQND